MSAVADSPNVQPLEARLAAAMAELAAAQKTIKALSTERDKLRAAYDRATVELELLKRRIFVAKAERVDTAQLELEFGRKLAEVEKLAGTIEMPVGEAAAGAPASDGKRRGHAKGGRRDVRDLGLDEQRLEIPDPIFEALVARGEAARAGFEESARLTWSGRGMKVLVVARVKYRVTDRHGVVDVETAPVPTELIERCLATPSLLAHIVVAKHCDGLPLHRVEAILAREGCGIDRGTMCRWLDEIGQSLRFTVCEAMRKDSLHAFCIATDATGIRILPERGPEAAGQRRPCRRGQIFVQIADRDHILFSYQPRGTSDAAKGLFEGYAGYVQADASSVFDALFGGKADEGGREEVACWAHARRKFWEAASNKCAVAREALLRIGRIFELDASWKDRPPNEIRSRRQSFLKTHVTSLMDWVVEQFALVEHQRGDLRSALGYVKRNRVALERFLSDGRLQMTNNASERALRGVAVGRKSWLFSGSDGHAESAAALMSLIASAKLHGIEPEGYLRDLIRVAPHWEHAPPLALTPKHWKATRALLEPHQLAAEFGHLDLPAAFPHLVPEEQRPPG